MATKPASKKPKRKAPSRALVPVKGKGRPSTKPTSRAHAREVDRKRRMRIFLIVLEKTCNVTAAARAAGVDRGTPYDWRQVDDDFSNRWHDAEQAAVDRLEQIAYERAAKGESDRMLEILLKAHRPHKYVEKQQVLHAHALTQQTQDTLEGLGLSLDQAARLYKERLG